VTLIEALQHISSCIGKAQHKDWDDEHYIFQGNHGAIRVTEYYEDDQEDNQSNFDFNAPAEGWILL
jgi:hypothetical protein